MSFIIGLCPVNLSNMDDISIEVALGYMQKVVYDMFDKHFIQKKKLSEYEQRLLNNLHTLVIHSQYQEMIRQHFSTKN